MLSAGKVYPSRVTYVHFPEPDDTRRRPFLGWHSGIRYSPDTGKNSTTHTTTDYAPQSQPVKAVNGPPVTFQVNQTMIHAPFHRAASIDAQSQTTLYERQKNP
jgi:hypothetical protein